MDAATAPCKLPEFSAPPPSGGKDRWESRWIQRGWLVRVHTGPRKRTFQPIHRAAPVGGDLLPLRVTVGFEEDTHRRHHGPLGGGAIESQCFAVDWVDFFPPA